MNRFARWSCLPVLLIIGAAGIADERDTKEKAAADERRLPAARVHVYPNALKTSDALTDGDNGKRIAFDGPTTLIWIDRMPGARFEHPTEYVLISGKETRVIKGGWWPVLNGKRLFGDDAGTSVKMPISLIDPTRRDEP